MTKLLITALLFCYLNYSSNLSAQEKVNWMTFEEALKLQELDPRKIFIDMYTDWCGWCKRMDKETFQNDEIARYINQNFYPVKFNAETKNDIKFQNETYSFIQQGGRAYHELAVKLSERLGRLSYPTVIFMDENLDIIQPIAGFLDVEQFAPIISYIAGEHYLQTPWKQFQSNFSHLVFN